MTRTPDPPFPGDEQDHALHWIAVDILQIDLKTASLLEDRPRAGEIRKSMVSFEGQQEGFYTSLDQHPTLTVLEKCAHRLARRGKLVAKIASAMDRATTGGAFGGAYGVHPVAFEVFGKCCRDAVTHAFRLVELEMEMQTAEGVVDLAKAHVDTEMRLLREAVAVAKEGTTEITKSLAEDALKRASNQHALLEHACTDLTRAEEALQKARDFADHLDALKVASRDQFARWAMPEEDVAKVTDHLSKLDEADRDAEREKFRVELAGGPAKVALDKLMEDAK